MPGTVVGATELLLGFTLVVTGSTVYAASLRTEGFGRAAPFLAALFAAAGWMLWIARIPAVPHLLVAGAIAVLALGFLGDR